MILYKSTLYRHYVRVRQSLCKLKILQEYINYCHQLNFSQKKVRFFLYKSLFLIQCRLRHPFCNYNITMFTIRFANVQMKITEIVLAIFSYAASEKSISASFTMQQKLEVVCYLFRVLSEVSPGTPTSLNDDQINDTATTIHFSRA